MFRVIIQLATLSSVLACFDHSFNIRAQDSSKDAGAPHDWSYDNSYDWGSINPDYALCQNGTTQSPINLAPELISRTHVPTFKYSTPVSGLLYNSGHGPAFTVNNINGKDITGNPSFTWNGETLYLKSWHTHAPSEHLTSRTRTRGELHLVHGNSIGHEAGVLSLLINPYPPSLLCPFSPFSSQFLSSVPPFTSSANVSFYGLDMSLAISEVGLFKGYWTYKGSLTTPPCGEGIRWWVAGKELLVGGRQMRELLSLSTFSARVEQMVWEHEVGVLGGGVVGGPCGGGERRAEL